MLSTKQEVSHALKELKLGETKYVNRAEMNEIFDLSELNPVGIKAWLDNSGLTEFEPKESMNGDWTVHRL